MPTDAEMDRIFAKLDDGRKLTREEKDAARVWLREQADDDEHGHVGDLDDDEIEWWEDGRDGSSRGARMTVRTARHHAPEWVRELVNREDAEEASRKLERAETGEPERAPRRKQNGKDQRRDGAGSFARHTGVTEDGKLFVRGRRIA